VSRGLRKSSAARDRSARQLSTGLRVSRARDDVVAMSRAEILDAKSRSGRVALRNIDDGLSALAMADGELQQIGGHLKRLRELAVQGASELLADNERAYLAQEADALVAEITRGARNTLFNYVNLTSPPGIDVALMIDTSGTMGGEINQVKNSVDDFAQAFADANLDIALGLVDLKAGLGDIIDGTITRVGVGNTGFTEALFALDTSTGAMDAWSGFYNASGIDDFPGETDPDNVGFRKEAKERHMLLITDTGRERDLIEGDETQADVAQTLAEHNIIVDVISPSSDYATTYSEIVAETGGEFYDIGNSNGSGIPAALDALSALIISRLEDDNVHGVQAGIQGGAAGQVPLNLFVDATEIGLGIGDLDYTTADGSRAAIDTLDAAIDTLAGHQAQVGSADRRLSSARAIQEQALLAGEATRSQLQDADMAYAAAQMAKAQILQDAQLALAAQARSIERSAVEWLFDTS